MFKFTQILFDLKSKIPGIQYIEHDWQTLLQKAAEKKRQQGYSLADEFRTAKLQGQLKDALKLEHDNVKLENMAIDWSIKFARPKTKHSINETAEFLAQLAKKLVGVWAQKTMPSLHNPNFKNRLTYLINDLPAGLAFAVHFVAASASGSQLDLKKAPDFLTLGPSFICTKGSDVNEIFNHLMAVLNFQEETYQVNLDGATFMKIKCLGEAADLSKAIFNKKAANFIKTDPSFPTQKVLAIPLPKFELQNIHHIALEQAKRYSDLAAIPLPDNDWEVTGITPIVLNLRHKYLPEVTLVFFSQTGKATFIDSFNKKLVNFDERPFGSDSYLRDLDGTIAFYSRIDNKLLNFEFDFKPKRFIHADKKAVQKELIKIDHKKIITADIEGLIIDRKFNVPYLAQWYTKDEHGKEIFKVYDFNHFNRNHTEMLKAFWRDLLIFAKGATVFFHNWAGYDAYHALNPLILLNKEFKLHFNPVVQNGSLINLKVFQEVNGEKVLILDIKDSIKIMPMALGPLAKSFNVDTMKEHFPHYLENEDLPGTQIVEYSGKFPDYKYFEPKRTSYNDWLEMKNEFKDKKWNFMDVSLKYLHSDVKAQFEVLIKFYKEFAEIFKIDVTNNLSMPGIAFKTWRATELVKLETQSKKPVRIPDLSLDYDEFLRSAYMGGIVDVYKPHLENGFAYDINSLYPTAMLNRMPVGVPHFSHPTVDLFLNSDWFGFVKATVQTPINMKIGLLATRRDGKLITPAGTFTEIFFSDELRFALKHGYKLINIHWGFLFESNNYVFDEFIKNLNQMKVNASIKKDLAKRTLAKFMMNSCYGRFGMHPNTDITGIYDQDQALKIAKMYPIKKNIEFDNGFELIQHEAIPYARAIELINNDLELQDLSDFPIRGSNTNIPIAAAVTANARMIINEYKMKCLELGIDVYYSDTDSIYVDKKVPDSWLHNERLGAFKLEHVIREAYFLAPKLYWMNCVDSEGKLYEVSKSRGYGGTLSRDQIMEIYNNKSIMVNKHKWFRDWKQHTVYFNMESQLNITGVFSKRTKITSNLNGNVIWTDTKPLNINDPIDQIKPFEVKPRDFKNSKKDALWFQGMMSIYGLKDIRARARAKK